MSFRQIEGEAVRENARRAAAGTRFKVHFKGDGVAVVFADPEVAARFKRYPLNTHPDHVEGATGRGGHGFFFQRMPDASTPRAARRRGGV